MSRAGGIRAARAFVELGVQDRLTAGLRSAQRQLRSFAASASQIGGSLAGIGVAGIAGLGVFVKQAGDAAEGLSRFNAVFGSEASAASRFADELASSIGRSGIEIRDSLATYQSFFVGLGFGSSEARGLSQEIASLALDFASFNNLTDEDAIQRFIAGLSGSSEVFDKFGINIKSAALNQELLSKGIAESSQAATEQQKVIARLGIITKSLGDQGAIGDAERTAGSFNNQMKRLSATLTDVAVEIGTALLPVATKIAATLSTATRAVADFINANSGIVVAVAAVAAVAAGIGLALVGVGGAAAIASIAIGGLASSFAVIASPIGIAVAAIGVAGVALFRFTGLADRSVGFLSSTFSGLVEPVRNAVSEIVSALSRGDIASAAQLAGLNIQVGIAEGLVGVARAVQSLAGFLTPILTDIWVKFRVAGIASVSAIRIALEQLKFATGFTTAAERAANIANIAAEGGAGASRAADDANSESSIIQSILDGFITQFGDSAEAQRDALRRALEQSRDREQQRTSENDPGSLRNTLAGLLDGLDGDGGGGGRSARVGLVGTTSGFSALRGIVGASTTDRTATAAERAAGAAEKVARIVERRSALFA